MALWKSGVRVPSGPLAASGMGRFVMQSAIKRSGRLPRLDGRVDVALSHMATKADIAELRILIALNIGIALAILSMLFGWLPPGA